eukprot:3940826-Rhodomonas_salina.3
MRCPVLTQRMVLTACCAMSGTHIGYAATSGVRQGNASGGISVSVACPLSSCTMSSTDAPYAGTSRTSSMSSAGSSIPAIILTVRGTEMLCCHQAAHFRTFRSLSP